MNWSEYRKFKEISEQYLPTMGQGDTMATQIVTAVNRLVYKWYNDGDVYDNTHYLSGWCNDVSDCANWLFKYACGAELESIETAETDDDYEWILWEVACANLDPEYLAVMDKRPAQGSVYDCPGPFRFVEIDEDEEDY